MMIVEIGGIGNTEEEVNRTIAVLGKAIAKAFVNDTKNNYIVKGILSQCRAVNCATGFFS